MAGAPAGTEGYAKAEVTAGGVHPDELSSKTMESRKVPGLVLHWRGGRCHRTPRRLQLSMGMVLGMGCRTGRVMYYNHVRCCVHRTPILPHAQWSADQIGQPPFRDVWLPASESRASDRYLVFLIGPQIRRHSSLCEPSPADDRPWRFDADMTDGERSPAAVRFDAAHRTSAGDRRSASSNSGPTNRPNEPHYVPQDPDVR